MKQKDGFIAISEFIKILKWLIAIGIVIWVITGPARRLGIN